MKITKCFTPGVLAAALALAGSVFQAQAQTVLTNTFDFTFAGGGNTSPFNSTWIYWYNSPGGNAPVLVDPKTDASNPTPGAATSGSGSLMVVSPLAGGTQNVFFGTFASNSANAYDFSDLANTTVFDSVSFDILVAAGTPLSSATNYGSIHVGFINNGYGFNEIDAGSPVTIPASAASNWFHVVVPIDHTQAFNGIENVPGIALDINSYGGYPNFTITNWIDNVTLNGSSAPPPLPPTLKSPFKPITGMNFFDTTPASQYDRYQLLNTNGGNGGLSFVGHPSVTYSWTIKSFPMQDPGYSYQAHFFLVSGSDNTNTITSYPGQYDQAADYNLANCIFVTVQSDGNGGAICNFRYKTNEIGGNGMLFNTVDPTNTGSNPNGWPIMPVAALPSTQLLGTWSLTFAGGNNVTIASPSGATTNFIIDAASANLFAEPCSLILGAQPNSVFTTDGQDVVYSSFSLTGTPAAFTDNFETDTVLNTNHWSNFGNDLMGAVLVPPSAAYWVPWTLPANQFSLYVASNLPAGTLGWKSVTSLATIKNGATEQALVASNALPQNGAQNGYFSVISNTFSQLVIVLPGQTFTPGVAPGYSGTPTEVDLSGGPYVEEDMTIYACDAAYNPVSGVTDTIALIYAAGGDNNAILPNATAMVNGQVSFNSGNPFLFGTSGTWTITAQDNTQPTIQGVSASVVVGP